MVTKDWAKYQDGIKKLVSQARHGIITDAELTLARLELMAECGITEAELIERTAIYLRELMGAQEVTV